MAAVEADILRGRMAAEGPGEGVSVTTLRDAALPVASPVATAPPGPVRALLQQPAVRKTLPFVGIALVLLLSVIVYISLSTPPPRMLYPEMADTDKQAAQQLLQKNGIDVHLDSSTGAMVVEAAQFHEARIMLAAAGLPRESTGSSVLNETMPLGTSQFMEQARYNAAVEEELAQSIRRINTIRDARVHLAMPRQSAFIRDRVDPKASVIVTPFAGRALSDGQVQAIVHLVSSSIPYMSPAGVSVVDQFGRLLTDAGGAQDLNAKQLELRQKVEADYADRVNQILAPIFGADNVRAQVSADLDFSVIEQTVENFDPQGTGTRVRSEQVKQSETTEQRATGVPGSLSNEPPAAPEAVPEANAPAAAPDNTVRGQESSQSRNYEMDRSVKYVVDPAPRLRRVTVGVAINDAIAAPGATASPQRKPLPETEIARLTSLVQGAVGFSAERGDLVNIISTSFETPQVQTPLPFWQQPAYVDLAKYGSVALAIALFALLVIRPVVNRLTYVPPAEAPRDLLLESPAGMQPGSVQSVNSDGEPGEADAVKTDEADVELREGETLEELRARLKPRKKTAISAEMLDTANSYDDKVTVVRMMVSQDAKRVALVLRNLIARDLT